jgi:hypothetical protein
MTKRAVFGRAQARRAKTARFVPIGSQVGKPTINERRSLKAGRTILDYRYFTSTIATTYNDIEKATCFFMWLFVVQLMMLLHHRN